LTPVTVEGDVDFLPGGIVVTSEVPFAQWETTFEAAIPAGATTLVIRRENFGNGGPPYEPSGPSGPNPNSSIDCRPWSVVQYVGSGCFSPYTDNPQAASIVWFNYELLVGSRLLGDDVNFLFETIFGSAPLLPLPIIGGDTMFFTLRTLGGGTPVKLSFEVAIPATRGGSPECSDGIDNDGDNKIDLEDNQCRGADQTSESDPRR
jgi:hypothetical protein